MSCSDDCIVKIEKLDNGYEVEIRDAAQASKNDKSGMNAPYQDPWHCYAFQTVDEVVAFLKANLDKATPEPSYDDAFEMAATESEVRTSPKPKKKLESEGLGFAIHSTQRGR